MCVTPHHSCVHLFSSITFTPLPELLGLSLWRAVTLFFLFAAVFESSLAYVLAVDYGSDWINVSLMNPCVHFDVLLNKDSKQKIPSCVAWKKDERLFGSDATNIVRPMLFSF
jgi:hypothetical protein